MSVRKESVAVAVFNLTKLNPKSITVCMQVTKAKIAMSSIFSLKSFSPASFTKAYLCVAQAGDVGPGFKQLLEEHGVVPARHRRWQTKSSEHPKRRFSRRASSENGGHRRFDLSPIQEGRG